MEKSSVVAFRGWIRFCMEILYLGYGHPFASDFCRALQRYLGTKFLPIAMKTFCWTLMVYDTNFVCWF